MSESGSFIGSNLFCCCPKICLNLMKFHSFRSLEGRCPKIVFIFRLFPYQTAERIKFPPKNEPTSSHFGFIFRATPCVYIYIYRYVAIYLYIYICCDVGELAGCPPFFCFKASWLSTFFFHFFSLTKKKKNISHPWLAHFPSVSNHLSRPAGCPPPGQLVVHIFCTISRKNVDNQLARGWTTSWPWNLRLQTPKIHDCFLQKTL